MLLTPVRPIAFVPVAFFAGLGICFTGIPAWGQLRLVPEASEQVYQTLPQLPREDGYTPTPDGAGSGGTLVQRLMQYHIQIMGRPATSRLDWRLTLADYLEINEPILAQQYPGATTLDRNPLNGDKGVIQGLSRRQRYDLVDALILALGGDPTPPTLYIPPAGSESISPDPLTSPEIRLPQPGGADLLRLN